MAYSSTTTTTTTYYYYHYYYFHILLLLLGLERGPVELSDRSVLQYHLPPFQAATDAGVWTIMESFNEISGVPVVSSGGGGGGGGNSRSDGSK